MSLNITSIKTPGVYVDEMSLFPPSVAQVDTAIPAFIGPTEIAYATGQPVKINSMAEYRRLYGGAPDRKVNVKLDANNNVESIKATNPQYLFDSLTLYFSNGGEKCYIVSTNTYANDSTEHIASKYTLALGELSKFDEPTLIVMPDAARLSSGLAGVQQEALNHCATMQDRFAILDVSIDPTKTTDQNMLAFRSGVVANHKYGAAYFPYLKTSLPLSLDYTKLMKQDGSAALDVKALLNTDSVATALTVVLDRVAADRATVTGFIPATGSFTGTDAVKRAYLKTQLEKFQATSGATNTNPALTDDAANVGLKAAYAAYVTSNATLYTSLKNDLDPASTTVDVIPLFSKVVDYISGFLPSVTSRFQSTEANLRSKSATYAALIKGAEAQGIIVPPSGAVAGAYARTDSDRGVWKSPANVGLNYVTGPTINITDADQTSLNIDDNGKSINAIRSFTGKGTLVWGARTLAGNDNEWRYVSVRRFFIMAEESIRKATAQFVFEPNDANTWVRIRAMIENFLTLQWRAGALAGAKTDQAFFVRVGLGQTMTPQDVLEGRMIVEIGMAVVRPAEFIVLRFSHKMQEA